MAAWMLHGLCFGEEAGARNLVFPCKVAAGDDERYLVCATGAAAVVPDAIGSFYVFCNKWLFLWYSSMRFLKLWLQIALEWLHECCMGYVLGRKPEHETLCFSVWSGCRRRWKVPRVCDGCGWGRLVVFFCRSVTVAWSCFGCACVCVRSYSVFCIGLEWLHDVAWAMFWGGSRSTKPCVFPCKVAAGDDERYLVCATGAAAVVPDAIGSFYVFCNKWLFLWCSSMRFLKLWLQIALEWLHDVAWAMFWGGSRSTKPCVFPCKVAAGDDERYLVCATGAAVVGWPLVGFFLPQCNGGLMLLWVCLMLLWVCLCVRSHRVFWHLRLQIAFEWLHDVAWAMFWGGSRSTKPFVFPCKVAAGDDERYFVCATGAAGVGLSFFFAAV